MTNQQSLPNPPVLKTTMIHINKDVSSDQDNYELLTNDYSSKKSRSSSSVDNGNVVDYFNTSKRKRRKSSNASDSGSVEMRKTKAKQVHSVIEKRRRTKINREFEALKYLIPACRGFSPPNGTKQASQATNNSRIDGMYKLTILKSSVEYILYLHHIIQKQHEKLKGQDNYNFDINFSEVPLDVNGYRDIDKEFNFKKLANEFMSRSLSQPQQRSSSSFAVTNEEDEEYSSSQVASPNVTPTNESEVSSIVSMPNKASNISAMFSEPAFQSKNGSTNAPLSSGISPLTTGLSSSVSPNFSLPAPAIRLTETGNKVDNIPRQKCSHKDEYDNQSNSGDVSPDSDVTDKDISRMLLSLRKSSIDNLLN